MSDNTAILIYNKETKKLNISGKWNSGELLDFGEAILNLARSLEYDFDVILAEKDDVSETSTIKENDV